MDVEFEWTDNHTKAVETLKLHLNSNPILAHPNFDHSFVIHTDASLTGLGAVLSQVINGEEFVIMDRVMIAATPSYNLIRVSDDTKIGWMEKKLISFMDTFDVYMEGKGGFGITGLFKPDPAYRIEGDFLDRNFVFKNEEGKVVAKANMDGWIQFDMFNHYQIQVAEGMDALLVLACVCCIDEEFDEEHQKRREERES